MALPFTLEDLDEFESREKKQQAELTRPEIKRTLEAPEPVRTMVRQPEDRPPVPTQELPFNLKDLETFEAKHQAEESPFWTSIKRGTTQTVGLLQGAYGLVGSAVKSETMKEAGFRNYQESMRKAHEETPRLTRLSDVWKEPGKLGLWATETFGEMIPTIIEGFVGAAVGGVIGGPLGAVAGGFGGSTLRNIITRNSIKLAAEQMMKKGFSKNIAEGFATHHIAQIGEKAAAKMYMRRMGAKAGLVGATAALEGGGNWGDLMERGIDAPWSAIATGTAAGFLELWGGIPNDILNRYMGMGMARKFKTAIENRAIHSVGQMARQMIKNMPEEAIQEMGQEALSLLNLELNDPSFKLLSAGNLEQIIESGAAGALMGGAGGIVSGFEWKQILSKPGARTIPARTPEEQAKRELLEDEPIGVTTAKEVLTGTKQEEAVPPAGTEPAVTPEKPAVPEEEAEALGPEVEEVLHAKRIRGDKGAVPGKKKARDKEKVQPEGGEVDRGRDVQQVREAEERAKREVRKPGVPQAEKVEEELAAAEKQAWKLGVEEVEPAKKEAAPAGVRIGSPIRAGEYVGLVKAEQEDRWLVETIGDRIVAVPKADAQILAEADFRKAVKGSALETTYDQYKTLGFKLAEKDQSELDLAREAAAKGQLPLARRRELEDRWGPAWQGKQIRHDPGQKFPVGSRTLYGQPSKKEGDKQVTITRKHPILGTYEVKEWRDKEGNKIIAAPIFSKEERTRHKQITRIIEKNREAAEWYVDANNMVSKLAYGRKPEEQVKLLKVFAILSAGRGVGTNTLAFKEAIDALEDGTFKLGTKQAGGVGVTPDAYEKIMEIWEGKDDYKSYAELQARYGDKVGAFLLSLTNPASREAVTVDRHMARLYGYNVGWAAPWTEKVASERAGIKVIQPQVSKMQFGVGVEIQRFIEDDIRKIAAKLDMPTPAVQAALWVESGAAHMGDAISIREAMQWAPLKYIQKTMQEAVQAEPGAVAIHYSPETLTAIKAFDIGGPVRSDSKEVVKRQELGTELTPFTPAGYFYYRGTMPEQARKGEKAHVALLPEKVYDAVEDTLGLWNAAERRVKNDKGLPADLTGDDFRLAKVNAMLHLLKEHGFLGLRSPSPGGRPGESWVMLFGETPVEAPVAKGRIAVSTQVESILAMPEKPSEILELGYRKMQPLWREVKEIIDLRYPEIKANFIRPAVSRFAEATSGVMEYGYSIEASGPIRSIKALNAELGILKDQNVVFTFVPESEAKAAKVEKVQQLDEKTGEVLFGNTGHYYRAKVLEKYARDPDAIMRIAEENGVTDIQQVVRDGEMWIEIAIGDWEGQAARQKKAKATEKLFDILADPRYPVHTTDDPIISVYQGRDTYQQDLVDYHGAKRGGEIYEKATRAGEVRTLGLREVGHRYDFTGGSTLAFQMREGEVSRDADPLLSAAEEARRREKGVGEALASPLDAYLHPLPEDQERWARHIDLSKRVISLLKEAGFNKAVLDRVTLELRPGWIDVSTIGISERSTREWKELGKPVGGQAAGAALANKERALIILAMQHFRENPAAFDKTVIHESFHIASKWLLGEDYDKLMKHFSGNEEAAADAYAEYVTKHRREWTIEGVTYKAPDHFVDKIFEAFHRFLLRLASWMDKRGWRRPEDFFERLRTGKYADEFAVRWTSGRPMSAYQAQISLDPELRFKPKELDWSGVLPQDVAKRMEQARGAPKESRWQRLQERMNELRSERKHFPGLATIDDKRLQNRLNDVLRQHQDIGEFSKDHTLREMAGFIQGLDRKQYELYRMNIIHADLVGYVEKFVGTTIKEGDLPFGYKTVAEVQESYSKLQDLAAKDPMVKVALEKRKRSIVGLARELVKHKLLKKEVLDDPNYYHHQVLAFMEPSQATGAATGQEVRTKWRPWQAARVGSALDYNTEYVEAEFVAMATMRSQLETKKSMDRIDNMANIIDDLKGQARRENERLMKEKLGPAYDLWAAPYRQQIAMGMGGIFKLAKNDKLEYDASFTDLVEAMVQAVEDAKAAQEQTEERVYPSVDHPQWWSFLTYLVEKKKPGAMQAATIYKAIANRNKDIKETLGSDFVTYKKMIPDGYTLWEPAKEKWFWANSVTDQILEDLRTGAKTIDDVSVRKVLARGKSTDWVIPEGLAKTMDNFRPFIPKTGWEKISEGALTGWKQWVLLNPVRVLKYNINNLSGDADIALAYAPEILKFVPRAAADLAVFMKHTKMPEAKRAEMEDLVRMGVIGSGFAMQEVDDIVRLMRQKDVLKHVITGEKPALMRRYWETTKGLTAWRENWLRLAAYRWFLENLQQGKKLYGASKRDEVDAVTNLEEKAAKLARELIGDYGNISYAGQWMRKRLIPFYSWLEINAPRYVYMLKNLKHENRDQGAVRLRAAGVGLGKMTFGLGKLALKANIIYGAVHAFNYMISKLYGDDDLEEQLGMTGRRQLHMILGRREDGRLITLRFQGALSDALDWFGLEDWPADIADVAKGYKTVGEKAKETGLAFGDKWLLGLRPESKLLYESLTGTTLFPEPLAGRGRPIRDTLEHVLRTFSLDMPYQWAAGKPKRGEGWKGHLLSDLSRLILYQSDPGEQAYYDSRKLIFDYLEKQGVERPSAQPTSRANALYYYRQALKFADLKAAEKYLKQYYDLGGKFTGVRESIRNAHPMASLPSHLKFGFRNGLSVEQEKRLQAAIEWWRKTYHGQRTAGSGDQ